jgi:hypothetical protein
VRKKVITVVLLIVFSKFLLKIIPSLKETKKQDGTNENTLPTGGDLIDVCGKNKNKLLLSSLSLNGLQISLSL